VSGALAEAARALAEARVLQRAAVLSSDKPLVTWLQHRIVELEARVKRLSPAP
jgi:hypothetical protein